MTLNDGVLLLAKVVIIFMTDKDRDCGSSE